jgi:hypothetical protein
MFVNNYLLYIELLVHLESKKTYSDHQTYQSHWIRKKIFKFTQKPILKIMVSFYHFHWSQKFHKSTRSNYTCNAS